MGAVAGRELVEVVLVEIMEVVVVMGTSGGILLLTLTVADGAVNMDVSPSSKIGQDFVWIFGMYNLIQY